MENSKGFLKQKNGCHGRKYYPLDGKNPPGGQNDSKIIPLLRKRYRFRVDLHMCTMMQNHCIMCTHGIPNMENSKGFLK